MQSCAKVTETATFAPGLSNAPKNSTITAKGAETAGTPAAATGGAGTLAATIKTVTFKSTKPFVIS